MLAIFPYALVASLMRWILCSYASVKWHTFSENQFVDMDEEF